MKILELSPSLASGGAERFTVDLANELAKTQDVTILVMRKFPHSDFFLNEISPNIQCIQKNGRLSLLSKLWQVFTAFYWILKLKPDVVHAHTVAINWILLPSIFLVNTKFYFTIHNLANQECTTKLGYRLRKFFFKHRITPIAISSTCALSFKEMYNYPCNTVINNGCREIYTSEKFHEVQNEINRYKQNTDTKVFINVARIMPQKNHKLLIEAFQKFIANGRNAILLIIGDYQRIKGLKDKLDKSIKTDRIFFLGTKLNISDYLACADYFCLSSLWEGLPISLLEAGMAGCYPISTPTGGVLDVIKDSSWGIISQDFSVNGFVTALEQANQQKINKTQLKEKYSKEFSMHTCAKKYIKTFKIL